MEEHHEHSDEQGGFIEKRIDGAREFDEQEGGGWGGEKACAIKREREDDDEYDSERQRWDDSVKDEHEYECEEEEEEEDADERPDVFQYGMTCSSNELDELIRTHVMPIIRAWKNPTNVETAERCINALLSLPPDDDEQQHRPDEQQQQRAPWRRPQQPTLE
jgi:hypothetical protein